MKQFPIALFLSSLLLTSISSCNDESSSADTKAKAPIESTAAVVNGDLKIAYVNTDTIFEKNDMLKDLEEDFIQEKLTMENQFRSQYEKLEKDYKDAEAGAAQLSQEALQILGMKLQQREQDLMAQKQEMEQILLKSEQEKNELFYDQIRSFLDDYAKRQGYHMIYGYNGFGNVLYMDEQFDITQLVVDSLNTTYSKNKMLEQTAQK
jgi:outer membrane protein